MLSSLGLDVSIGANVPHLVVSCGFKKLTFQKYTNFKLKTNMEKQNQTPQLPQNAVSGSVTKKPINISTFKNAVSCKYLNKKIEVIKQQPNRNEIVIVRMAENKEDLETPSCQFETIKGKVCVTRIAMSNEGLEALHIAISQYLQNGCLTDR